MPIRDENVLDLRGDYEPARLAAVDRLLTASDVQLLSCRYWREGPDWQVLPRTVPDTFMLVPTVGGFLATVDGEEYAVRPGQALLLPDDRRHALRTLPGCAVLEQVSLHVHVWDPYHQPVVRCFAEPIQVLPAGRDWQAQLRLLCALDTDRRAAAEAATTALVPLLLAGCIAAGAGLIAADPAQDSRLGDTLLYIRAHLREELSVSFLAERVGLQPGRLRALFHEAIGLSPAAHLATERLRRAARLLRRTRRPVQAIAAEVGYPDAAYFNRRFRARYGCTPTVFRRSRDQV